MRIVGVDLGGTHVRAQCVAPTGEPLGARIELESNAKLGIGSTICQVVQAIHSASDGSPIDRIGIAIPGHIDHRDGVVRWAPNFGETVAGNFVPWKNVPVRALLAEIFPQPITMANDANAAALGEYRWGSGRGCSSCLVMVTLGTGIGGGVVLGPGSVIGGNDQPLVLVGGNQGGVELGHTVIVKDGARHACGSYGTIEAYAQRDAIVARTVSKLARHPESLVLTKCDHDPSKITPRMVAEAAAAGDALALQVWSEIGEFLGVAIGNQINLFAPDIVAVGGKMSLAWPHFSPSMMMAIEATAIPSLLNDVRVQRAELSEDAGILGAAALAT